MNAKSTAIALALCSVFCSAHAQHARLVHAAAEAAGTTDASVQQAHHVQAEHLAELDLAPAPHSDATVSVAGSNDPAAAATTTTAPAAIRPRQGIGDATRSLLQLQASGRSAAPMLPMLGEPATAAYQRHLDSFSHPIPEFFDTAVPTSSGTPQ